MVCDLYDKIVARSSSYLLPDEIQHHLRMNQLNSNGSQLLSDLAASRLQKQTRKQARVNEQKVHVVGAGGTLTAAYEQLRNAAEYAEEHVLLQRAIRRFYRRLFVLHDKKRLRASGEELIIELTHAGYLPNDSVPEDDVAQISAAAVRYYEAYQALRKNKAITYEQADKWTYELLSCRRLPSSRTHISRVQSTTNRYSVRHLRRSIFLSMSPCTGRY